MSNRSSKARSGSSDDELALVKATAWAWYLHGSGNEGKPAREFDPSRTKQPPRPSRYKLEAMRDQQQSDRSSQPSNCPSPGSPGNSLLDSYEIQSISKRLNYLLEDCSHADYIYVDDFDHPKKWPENDTRQKKVNGRMRQAFWMRHAAAVCRSRQGVVDAHLVVNGRTNKKHGSFVPL